MAETILDRLNLMFGNKLVSNLPRSGRDIDFARRLYPQPGISDAISGSGLGAYISGEKGYPKPKPMTSQPDTIAGEIGKGIYNIGIGPGLEALRLITAAPNEIPALGSAIGRSLALPSRGAYNQELTGIAKALASQRGQDEGSRSRALAMQKAMLAGDDPRANRPAFVGGPTYQQIPTSAEADAGLNAEIKRLQELSQIAEDQDMGSVGSDTDVALGRAGLVPSDPTLGDGYTGIVASPFGEYQDVDPATQAVPGDEQLTSRIKDIISDDATVSGVGAEEGDGTTTEQSSGLGSTDDLQFLGEEQKGADTGEGTTSDAEQGAGQSATKSDLYAGLLKESLDSYNMLLDNAPSEAKSMQEYKDEFSKATGIDISGDPDNKAAMVAFGTALMQNKAGKGFNVGNLLSETGKAGEKALPLIQEARKEARQAQIAAGKYALDATKEATSLRTKSLDEARKYLIGRRDRVLDQQRARIEAIEDFDKKKIAQQELETLKYGYDLNLEVIKAEAELNEDNFKVGNVKDLTPLDNKPNLKLTLGIKEKNGRPVYLYPAEQATGIGSALADVRDGLNGMNDLESRIIAAAQAGQGKGGISGQKLYEIYQGFTGSLGYDVGLVPQFDDKGNYTGDKKVRPIAEADAIRDRIISQFKRFLTQETGNGISNVDIQKIDKLLGGINFGTDPQDALNRIREAKQIFISAESKINESLKLLDNKDRYQTPEEYELTRRAVTNAINNSYYSKFGKPQDAFNFTTDSDGVMTFDLTQ